MTRYVYAVSHYGGVSIERAEVQKETTKSYRLTERGPAGLHRLVVPKNELHDSPREAAEAYLEDTRAQIAALKQEMRKLESRMGQVPGALKTFYADEGTA